MGILTLGESYPPAPSRLTDEQKGLVARVEKDVRDAMTGELATKTHDELVKQTIKDGSKTSGTDWTASARLAQDKVLRTEILIDSEAEKAATDRDKEIVYKTHLDAHYIQAVGILHNVSTGSRKLTKTQALALANVFVVDTTASGYVASDPTTWQFVHTTDSTGKVTLHCSRRTPPWIHWWR